MTPLTFADTRPTPARAIACLALSLALPLVPSCGGQRVRWTPQPVTDGAATTEGEGAVATTDVVASGSAQEQLQQLDGALRAQRYEPAGPVVHGDLPTNGLVAYAVEATPNTCFALAVIGEVPGQNIDMIVLDPFGRPAAHNVRPDNHPWVSFCAGAEGRFIARVQMAAGAGGYFFAPYQTASGSRMELSAFFGDEPVNDVQVAQLDAQTQQRIGAMDQQMQSSGYARVGDPAGVTLGTGEVREFPLHLTQGRCYAFAALGGPQAADTDIALTDAAGERLSADASQAQDSVIEFCAPGTGNYALAVRIAQGQGSIFAVGYLRGAAQSAQAQPVMESQSTAGAGLQENFALLDADMRARGYESHGASVNGRLELGGTQDLAVQLEGGLCYAILAVGDASVHDLDLRLLSPDGQEVDRDAGEDPRPTVRVCPRASGSYRMQVRMAAGSGAFVYAPYRWPRGTEGPWGLRGISWIRLSEVTALLTVEGYSPDPGFSPQQGALRSQGASAQQEIDLMGGECYAVVAVGGEGVHDLDLTLSRGGAQLSSDGSRNAFPSVRTCVQQDGRYQVNVTAASGSGSYHFQVFHRSEGGG